MVAWNPSESKSSTPRMRPCTRRAKPNGKQHALAATNCEAIEFFSPFEARGSHSEVSLQGQDSKGLAWRLRRPLSPTRMARRRTSADSEYKRAHSKKDWHPRMP